MPDRDAEQLNIAYLHGFASSPMSTKGMELGERLAARDIELYLPDLNRPSFASLTLSGGLQALDQLTARHPGPWVFVGSSMGGWLAARWAELNPERVRRLLLLCPGFDLINRWPEMLGARQMKRWEAQGDLPFPDALGEPVRVHWGLIEDARAQPPSPVTPCPTVIIHGRRDEVVSIDQSRKYASEHAGVRLVEVDDDHRLGASMATIWSEVEGFLLD